MTTSPFRLPRKTPFGIGENVAEWATGLSKLDQLYAQRPVNCTTEEFLRFALESLGISYQIEGGQLSSVPQTGATVVIANHPLGGIEGVILAELLLSVRPDVKILANQYLSLVPELASLFIGVDVLEQDRSKRTNSKALRHANQHLAEHGLLLIFPAGEVSHPTQRDLSRVEDKAWHRSVASLVKRHKALTVPFFIHGHNSKPFYAAGKIHPMLRTVLLGRELLNKKQKPIKLTIGTPIKCKELANLNDQQAVHYLRLNTYLLRHQARQRKVTHLTNQHVEPISSPKPLELILAEIQALKPSAHLLTSGQFSVYCAAFDDIPHLMHEIGRVREINFRAVGEGTGRAIDVDQFDRDYLHLFVWDNEKQSLVGAYRLGLVDKIIAKQGIEGLYSRTLFDYQQAFITRIGENKAIEMGRSVVAAEYQKSMSALLLLWKGIATFVSHHPQYTTLFGPVSISDEYNDTAKHLLTETLSLHHYDQESASLVKPLNPILNEHYQWPSELLSSLIDLQLLSRVIARIDDGKTVPVLLRQYLGLNGKLVSFNVDPDFNNALDGLIVVDLASVSAKTLGRYMTLDKAQAYLELHSAEPS
ncbi:lysophospholipid acyltransferase family protein [Vibrio agarivorans]|uniref:L-ornithine N(alpha)-acyltransferase n=1 Tax=Vibrio agarivorans TaxID=153622 RepID=A0ABT7XWM6_9VIBR|nr:lysophospholipid acyltransferase family protein [Vibrio agarivorans]MDN2480186.1 lysophospholipid acyltransferase family protein [Vibrio agarivorans]